MVEVHGSIIPVRVPLALIRSLREASQLSLSARHVYTPYYYSSMYSSYSYSSYYYFLAPPLSIRPSTLM